MLPFRPRQDYSRKLTRHVLEAGDRGGRARLKAATDQIEIVLRGRHML